MRIRFQLIVFMFLRMVLNTMHRMVYPFLAVFARGMGVDLTTVSFVVTARSFVGMFAPIFGSVSDSRGERRFSWSQIWSVLVQTFTTSTIPVLVTEIVFVTKPVGVKVRVLTVN